MTGLNFGRHQSFLITTSGLILGLTQSPMHRTDILDPGLKLKNSATDDPFPSSTEVKMHGTRLDSLYPLYVFVIITDSSNVNILHPKCASHYLVYFL